MEKSILKIKPYLLPSENKYPYANGIIWTCYGLSRNCLSCWVICDLIYVWTEEYTDENGNILTSEIVSESLFQFQMIVPKEILDIWGPDVVIDDYVLTYDPNFERE